MQSGVVQKREHTTEARRHCASFVEARERCFHLYGKESNEKCVKEALLEKRCLSFRLCPAEADEYYQRTECSRWAEAFCFGDGAAEADERETYNSARQRIERVAGAKKDCRKITYALSKCLSEEFLR